MTVRSLAAAAALSMIFALSACGGKKDSVDTEEDFSAIPVPPPPPAPSGVSYDVRHCLTQEIPESEVIGGGHTVGQAIFPDTLTLDFNRPAGFPNGRLLTDQVVDIMLAYLFLDLGEEGARRFADLPLNPPSNDVALPAGFPFLAPAQGNPPRADRSGRTFDFVDEDDDQYDRVDRVGMPLVSTAIVPFERKPDYNDATPQEDVDGDFVGDVEDELTALTNSFADDLTSAGYRLCAAD
ncbi:hypothetical protein [Novosphingopyxis sp.]|uniref:hypothetical protein n=1 Tax=Novosphingopyxis sp. TaxID=2709690 RepID=UPI003B5975DE